ncbi:MAG: autotransporter-associated beta strand repeat-containing protein [Akkermansia sp.]|nr:autotransporter-associated beta strand repeat-containing protein [Akkermansia sp.]
MKLRLPHKLQAALIATLASAALTTLSTGAAAYAATVSSPTADNLAGWFVHDTENDTWTYSGNYSANEPVTLGSSFSFTDASGAKLGFNVGARGTYTFAFTVDLSKLVVESDQILLTAGAGANASNYDTGIGMDTSRKLTESWNGTVAFSGTKFNALGNSGLVTIVHTAGEGGGYLYAVSADGVTQIQGKNGWSTLKGNYTINDFIMSNALKDAIVTFGVWQANGTWNNEATLKQAALALNEVPPPVVWAGTADNHTWAPTGVWANGATFANGGNVKFENTDAYKTVLVASDVTAKKVDVNADYTFVLDGGNLTAAVLAIGGDATGLTIDSGDGTTGTLKVNSAISAAGKTITVNNGAVLRAMATGSSFTLAGNGTYALADGVYDKDNGVTIGSNWTGTVLVTNTDASKNYQVNDVQLTNGTQSTLELSGFKGWLANDRWKKEVGTNIKLTDYVNGDTTRYAWVSEAYGQSGETMILTGKWSGTGTYNAAGTNGGTRYMHYNFKGDITEWTGAFLKTSQSTVRTNLTFSENAKNVNIRIDGSGNFGVIVDTDATFSKAVTADTFTVNENKTATLSAEVTVGGLAGAGNIASTGVDNEAYTSTITLNGTGSYEFGGAITGTHLLNKTGSGTQTINGPVTTDRLATSAGTTIFNGKVTVTTKGYTSDNLDRLAPTGSGTVYFNDGLVYEGSNTYAIVTANSATVHFGGETVLTHHIGQASGTHIVVDAGGSLTTTQMANSPSNLTSNGTVTVEDGATLTVNGVMWTTNLTNNGGTIATTGELRVATLSGSGDITVGADFCYDQNGHLSNKNGSYAGDITARSLQKYGSGKLTLSGVNAFTNATTLSAGTLEVAQVGSLGGQGVTTGANTSLIFNTAADGIYGGSITGTGSVTKSGEGNLVLTGANSYTGATAVNGGSLSLLGQNALGGNISVAENATLKLTASGTPVTTGTLTLAANSHLEISGINGTRARSGSSITVASAAGGITLNGVAPTLSGAYTGNVALSTDGKSLVVSDVTQTGSIYHLYILTGQSNSLGAVKDSPLSQGMLDAYRATGVKMYNANITTYNSKDNMRHAEDNPAWVQLAPQKPEYSGTYQGEAWRSLCMGPEYGFAYMMQKNGWFTMAGHENTDGLGIVLASLDGGGNQYWDKSSSSGYTYEDIVQSVKNALVAAKDGGYDAVSLDGLMYLQGESNDGPGANAAAARYAAFLGNLRSDLETWMAEQNITGIDLVFSNNTVTGEPHLGNNTRVTTANNLYNAAVSNGMVNADMNGRGHVLTNDLAVTNCDNMSVHYTGDSQLTIGARYAYAFAVQNGIDVGAVRGQEYSNVTLDQAKAWWMEKVPGETDIAKWDISSSVSSANTIAEGQTLRVGGLLIEDVYHNGATGMGQGSVTINGGNLSLGTGGIELTGADLAIGSAVDVRESQTWKTGDHTLTTSGTIAIAEGKLLTIDEAASFNFTDFSGTGSLAIGSGATVGMSSAAFDTKEHHVGYSDGDNGYMEGYVVLSTLTGENSVITLGDNLSGADALAGGTFDTIDVEGGTGVSLVVNMGGESSTVYYVRKGTVTYDAGEKFGKATELLLNTVAGEQSPAVLNLSSSLQGGLTVLSEGNGGTISIGTGVELAESSLQTGSASVTLTGSGTFVMNEKSGDVSWPLPTGVSLAQGETGWTGIVRISGGNFKANNLDALANGLYSTIELNGVSGWTGHSADTLGLNLLLTDKEVGTSAWKFNAGSSSANTYDSAPGITYTGKLSGTGTLEKVDGYSENFTFAGDISDWTGKFIQNSSGTRVSRLTFKGGASTIKIDTENKTTNSKIGIAVGDGSTAFNATFTEQSNLQGVDELRVRDKATAEFQGTVNASGTAYLEGSAAVTNSGTMTLNSLTMATGSTFTNTGSLTLNGTITFGSAGIANNGVDAAVTLNSGSIFNLTNLQATEDGVYTLFTTNSVSHVDLSGYHFTAANIAGVEGKDSMAWVFGKDGTVTGRIARDLVWAGTSGNNTWTTDPDKQNWNEPGAAAFKQGDKSTFSGAAGDATTAVLGEDITTSQMILGVEGGAANLTVQNGEGNHYSLQVDDLVLNANSSLTIKGDATNKSYIAKVSTYAAGSSLSIENTEAHYSGGEKTIKGNLTIGDGAVFYVETAADSLDYNASNTITVNQGGELALGAHRWTINTGNKIVLNGGTITGAGQGSNGALDFNQAATVAVNADSEISAAIRLRANPTMNVAENATLTVSGTISGNNTITKDGAGTMKLDAATGASQSFNTLGAKSGTVEIAGTVNLTGSLDLSSSGSYTGSAVIDGTGQLTANNVWMRSASHLSLEEGGKLLTKNITITGGEGGAEVSTTSDNQAYDTNQASFTIRNADVTVRSAITGNTIANLLQESTLQTGQNVTLSHAGNTLTSTTVTGNTLTVGADMQLGDVALTGGNLAVNAEATVDSLTATQNATLTVAGRLKIAENGSVQVTDATLNLAGSGIIDLSAMHLDGTSYYVKVAGSGETPNGFSVTDGSVQFVTLSGAGQVQADGNVQLLYRSSAGELNETTGKVEFSGEPDYATFTITTGSESLAEIKNLSKAGGETVQLQHIELHGGSTLNVDEETMNTSLLNPVSGGTRGIVNIAGNSVVTTDGTAKNISLTGSGVYALKDNSWNLPDSLATEGDDHWKGIVRVSNVTTKVSVTKQINGIMDTTPEGRVELMNVTAGYLGDDSSASAKSATVKAGIILTGSANDGTGTGFAITDGFSGNDQTFTGSVSGHGDLVEKFNPSGSGIAGNQGYIFQGDISGWDGSFKFETSKGVKTVTYSGNAWQVASGISQTSTNTHTLDVHYAAQHEGGMQVTGNVERATSVTNALNLHVDEDATFTGEVKNASSFTVAEGKTATLQGEGKDRQLGNVTMEDNASLNIMNIADAAKLSVGDVTIGAGATMGVYTNGTATEANEGKVTIASSYTLSAGNLAKLNSDLEMAHGSRLDVSQAQVGSVESDLRGLIMGSSVTIQGASYEDGHLVTGTGVTLVYTDDQGVQHDAMADVDGYLRDYFSTPGNQYYVLFDSVEKLYLNGATEPSGEIAFNGWDKPFTDANTLFNNVNQNTYAVVYSFNGTNVGTLAICMVPEPTTGTLSLLALAALAARRRRRS